MKMNLFEDIKKKKTQKQKTSNKSVTFLSLHKSEIFICLHITRTDFQGDPLLVQKNYINKMYITRPTVTQVNFAGNI